MVDPAALLGDDAVLVDPGAWQVITVTGNDRVAFLHRLLTARIDDLAPGQGRGALLLTVKGQIVVAMQVCLAAETVRLVVPPGLGDTTVAALSRYAIMDDVALALESGLSLLAIYGPGAERRLGTVAVEIPAGAPLAHAERELAGERAWVIRQPGLGTEGFWVFASQDLVQKMRSELGAAGVGTLTAEQAEALRILAGEPRTGAEITDQVFPMEIGLDPLIDYEKGCYLGQEPIVRIRDRGHINWRLVGLRLRAEGPVAAGDRLESDARPKAGRVTSVARPPGELPVALALLHVSVPLGTVVHVHSGEQALDADVVAAGPGERP
jgi:folate-binding protein YgfZ